MSPNVSDTLKWRYKNLRPIEAVMEFGLCKGNTYPEKSRLEGSVP